MNIVHTALIVVGTLAIIEAVWGLASPKSIKSLSGWFVKVSPGRNKVLALLFALIAGGLCGIILAGQPLSSWILLGVAFLFAGLGLLCAKPGGFQGLLTSWILNRSQVFVRIIYGIELLVAGAIIWVALAGK